MSYCLHNEVVRNIFLLTGCPGAGKGTQARLLSQRLEIPNISTGDILREIAASQTDLGQHVARQMRSGAFVGDEIVNQAVVERIQRRDCQRGLILDGYPRTVSQARFLDAIVLSNDRLTVFDISVAPSEIIRRITNRRVCGSCGTIYNLFNAVPKRANTCDLCMSALFHRDDDQRDVIEERLNIYSREIEPLIEYYRSRGVYWKINGDASVADVSEQLTRTISGIVPVLPD